MAKSGLLYKDFKETHPEYDSEGWGESRAFYAGGGKLLSDQGLMRRVMPKHGAEEKDVYKERLSRSFYIPYAGEIIDSIVASLTAEPVTIQGETGDPALDKEGNEVPQLIEDEFYDLFAKDCSPPGGKHCSVNQLVRHQILTALQCKTAWTLVDLPDPGQEIPATATEQEARGLLNAYACILEPENVINWEEDGAGELVCALVRNKAIRWGGLGSSRDTVKETYTFYTAIDWERWSITYPVDQPPKDGDPMVFEGGNAHTFGRVPLLRLALPDGLYAMGKILSIAKEHFNKRNALSWSQLKNLLPILTANVSPTPMDPDADEAASKLLNQAYGPGRVLVIGEKEKLSYTAPDSAVYDSCLQDLSNLRDEMHRVLHHMALSVDNSGAALQRSAESKAIDSSSASVVLRALGGYCKEHLEDVYRMVSAGRGDDAGITWTVQGMDSFDEASVTETIEQAMTLEQVSVPSRTFKIEQSYKVAKAVLGKDVGEDKLATIRKELEENTTNEQFDQPSPREVFDAEQEAAAKAPPPGKGKGF